MTKMEPDNDVLAIMMADARACNRRISRDTAGAGDHRLASYCGSGRAGQFMAQLENGGWISRARIARAIGITKANASVIAGALYAQGLIERRYVREAGRFQNIVEWRRKEGGE